MRRLVGWLAARPWRWVPVMVLLCAVLLGLAVLVLAVELSLLNRVFAGR